MEIHNFGVCFLKLLQSQNCLKPIQSYFLWRCLKYRSGISNGWITLIMVVITAMAGDNFITYACERGHWFIVIYHSSTLSKSEWLRPKCSERYLNGKPCSLFWPSLPSWFIYSVQFLQLHSNKSTLSCSFVPFRSYNYKYCLEWSLRHKTPTVTMFSASATVRPVAPSDSAPLKILEIPSSFFLIWCLLQLRLFPSRLHKMQNSFHFLFLFGVYICIYQYIHVFVKPKVVYLFSLHPPCVSSSLPTSIFIALTLSVSLEF